MTFHHVGIACQDIQSFKSSIGNLFPILAETDIIHDPEQNVELCMLELENGLKVELIQGKTVENLVKKNITYYHLCFHVEDMNKTIDHLKGNGCIVVKEPRPAVLFDGDKVAFLFSPIGLIELVEEKK